MHTFIHAARARLLQIITAVMRISLSQHTKRRTHTHTHMLCMYSYICVWVRTHMYINETVTKHNRRDFRAALVTQEEQAHTFVDIICVYVRVCMCINMYMYVYIV
jgi:hypothetical protein